MKVNHAYKLNIGVVDIPGQYQFSGIGFLPLVTHNREPWQHPLTDEEKNKALHEAYTWLREAGLVKQSLN